MKRKVKDLSEKEKIQTLDALYTATSSLRDREAMKMFLRDLLTESERIMLGRRILIAQMLIEGRSRENIMEALRVGPDTIWRVQKWLDDQFPGLENAVRNMKSIQDNRKKKTEYAEPYTHAWMKKKYPLYYLLFPTFKKRNTKKK